MVSMSTWFYLAGMVNNYVGDERERQSMGSSDARKFKKPFEVFAIWRMFKGPGKTFI